jgi:superfamily I DNA/RNA helicase
LNPEHIIVDEFQDTDYRQMELIKKISGDKACIFCIGDPNQIIYSWRSGTDNIFNEFKNLFKPKELGLPLNYRSTRTIIEAANSFLYGSAIEGTKEYGSKIKITRHHDAFNEACYMAERIKLINSEGIPCSQMAVLYRRQLQLDIILEVFLRENIPCKVVSKNSSSDGDNDKEILDDEGVNLLTLHSSKGLEFGYVFIAGANMGNIPLSGRKSDEPEEMRLFYVGITRAKNYLEISYLSKPSFQGTSGYMSPYITMIPRELLSIEEEGSKNTISDLVNMLREERLKKADSALKKARHMKYGTGSIIYEDEDTVKVKFEVYGEKEFSKMFCPLEFFN